MSVQVTQKSGEGLSRVFGVVVPKDDLNGQLEAKIAEMRPQMNLKGFRPGKVPAMHVRKMYGRQMMQEIVDKAVSDASNEALTQAGARPAAQPDIKLSSDLGQVMDGKADLAFDLDVELMPEFEPADLAGVAFQRPTYAATDEEIDAQITEVAGSNRTFEAKDGAAADGDMVLADFVGRIDGEAFEGGSAEGRRNRDRLQPLHPRVRGAARGRQGRRRAHGEGGPSPRATRPRSWPGSPPSSR